jgi:hypothetical protein
MTIDTNARMRFMTNNLLDLGYNSFIVSSVADTFYQDDLTLPERTRTFKFGGRFTIDATNNKIYINGVTYTLTSGEYTSPEALAAHITTVVAASGVTCAYADYKFYFYKGITYTINAATTAAAVWETLGIIDGVDLTPTLISGSYKLTADLPMLHFPNEKITINFGYQARIGFIGIIGDLTQELKVPEGAIVTIKANNVNSFINPPVNKTLEWSRRGIFAFIDDVDGDGWQYVELTFEHRHGPHHSEMGYLYIGDYSTFNTRNVGTGIGLEENDTSMVSSSDDGQVYTNEKTSFRVYNEMQVGLANPANVNFLKRLFLLKKKSVPFFVAVDPKQRISETLDDMTMFCRFSKEPKAKHVQGSWFDLSFELEETL